MTPVGHSLVGATIGICLWPEFETRRARVGIVLAMILAANIPDLPLPYWGHTDYRVSHSIFCGLVIAAVIYLALKASALSREPAKLRLLVLASTVALFSHYLLDTFYNHGKGLAMFWPVSSARMALPISWFSHMDFTVHGQLFSWKNLRIWLIEFAAFGSASLMVLAIALPWQFRRVSREVTE